MKIQFKYLLFMHNYHEIIKQLCQLSPIPITTKKRKRFVYASYQEYNPL